MGDALARAKDDPYVQAMADALLNTDLKTRLILNMAATCLPPAPDDGIDGVYLGDLLIVDRSIKPKLNGVIFAEIAGEFCLRRLRRIGKNLFLEDDKGYALPHKVTSDDYFHGTVTHNIHAHLL
jgi:DNA polymerase V